MRARERLVRGVGALETLLRIAQLRRRDAWTRDRVEQHQREQLRGLVAHALANSRYYRERYRQAGLGPDAGLEELPIVNKQSVMERYDDFVTDARLKLADLEAHLARVRGDEFYLGRYRVMATGGTTGLRGVFVYAADEWALSVASTLRTSSFMGLRTRPGRRLRVASVTAASPVHWGGRYAATSGLGLASIVHLDARTPLPVVVEALNRHKPDLLSCYPSVASMLAREQLAGRLVIEPQAVATSGEPRSEELCVLMRRAWGDVLFDGYATTESGFCGMECVEHRGIHLLEDLTIFEVVDDEYRPVSPGTEGRRLLVTNLFNRTLPLIRYELSDMVVVSDDECPCGRPWRLATSISGRSEDVLRLPKNDGSVALVHPTTLTGVLESTSGVREFHVLHDRGRLVVSVAIEPDADADRLRGELTEEMRDALAGVGATCPVTIDMVDHIERRGLAGKVRLVEERG
jgi:phenylacetate-coenzyme A ligase PaaK-like adenylate-forming protein